MNFLEEMTSRDMEATFLDTCVKAFINNEWRAVRVQAVSSNTWVCRSLATGQEHSVAISDIDLAQPDLGMVWWRSNLYYIARSPERQWRRGLRPRGLTAYILKADGSVRRSEVGRELFDAVALAFLEGHREHPNILSPNLARRGKWLFLRDIPVGTVVKQTIQLLYPINLKVEGFEVCQVK